MTSPQTQYRDAVARIIQIIYDGQRQAIEAAAEALADQISKGRLIHVVGSGGHSMIGAEEMFYRAGGLVPVNPVFDPGVSLLFGALRSTEIERLPGYMPAVLKGYDLQKDDVIIVVNAYGINSATIDSALEAKRLGLKVIGITSTDTAEKLPLNHPSRHPSGKNLHEIVDIFVNTYVPMGDAVVVFENLAQKVGPISTIANAFAIEMIVVETVDQLLKRGVEPPIWQSSNSPGGDDYNRRHVEKYGRLVKHL